MKTKNSSQAIRLELTAGLLESVFDECDQYDYEETGGRVIGHFAWDCGTLVIRASKVIKPGPNTKRTHSSLFQDGEYQTEEFRRLEAIDPSIEHLGNWHTHHVNRCPTLSAGDVETYCRIVNHHQHNLDFFYALLVTNRNQGRTSLDRYSVRHYLFSRGQDAYHEILPTDVHIMQDPLIGPTDVRGHDQKVLEVHIPSKEPRRYIKSGRIYPLKCKFFQNDGSEVPIKFVEDKTHSRSINPVVSSASEDVAQLCAKPSKSAYHDAVHEIRPTDVRITQDPLIGPKDVRVHDRKVLELLFPSMKPCMSRKSGKLLWKGTLSLVDGSVMPIKVIEEKAYKRILYHPIVSSASGDVAQLCAKPFKSASHAIYSLELQVNREIYESATKPTITQTPSED